MYETVNSIDKIKIMTGHQGINMPVFICKVSASAAYTGVTLGKQRLSAVL